MKFLSIMATCLMVLAIFASVSFSQDEGYTFVNSPSGPGVCLGQWVPSSDHLKAGRCEGELLGLPQYSALSSTKTVGRLDELLAAILAIDEKMSENSKQLETLIEVTENTKTSIDTQVAQVGEILRESISLRFDTLLVQDRFFSNPAILNLRDVFSISEFHNVQRNLVIFNKGETFFTPSNFLGRAGIDIDFIVMQKIPKLPSHINP